MRHAGIMLEHESARPYRNRGYVLTQLDLRHFVALNPGNQVSALNGYCLDALDEIPAGCMTQFVGRPAQHYVCRGISLAEQQERNALAKKLVADVLAAEYGIRTKGEMK
jgi:hypothetical protein